jgi:hypothetical protein
VRRAIVEAAIFDAKIERPAIAADRRPHRHGSDGTLLRIFLRVGSLLWRDDRPRPVPRAAGVGQSPCTSPASRGSTSSTSST